MSEADGSQPSYAGLAAKVVVAAAWVAGAAVAADALLHGASREASIAAGLFLFAGPVIWLFAKAFAMRRYDEVQSSVAIRGLFMGCVFASTWPCLMIGGSVLSSLLLGDGQVNVSGMMQQGVTYAAIMPPLAFFMSELGAFAMLRVYGKRG